LHVFPISRTFEFQRSLAGGQHARRELTSIHLVQFPVRHPGLLSFGVPVSFAHVDPTNDVIGLASMIGWLSI
jgi:hypothetical protein